MPAVVIEMTRVSNCFVVINSSFQVSQGAAEWYSSPGVAAGWSLLAGRDRFAVPGHASRFQKWCEESGSVVPC